MAGGNMPPNAPTSPVPTNGSGYVSVYNIYLRTTVSDPDGNSMDVSFYWQNGSLIGTISHVTNNTQASLYLPTYINPDWLAHDTIYRWYAKAYDGRG